MFYSDDQFSKPDNQQPLNRSTPNIVHKCSGYVISDEAYATLMDIYTSAFLPTAGIEIASVEISNLNYSLDLQSIYSKLWHTFANAEEAIDNHVADQIPLSPAELDQIIYKCSEVFSDYVSEVNDSLEGYEPSIVPDSISDKITVFPFDSSEMIGFPVTTLKANLSSAINKIGFFLPLNESRYHTNIPALVSELTPVSTKITDIKELEEIAQKKDQETKSDAAINNYLSIKEDGSETFTTLSPYLLRSLILRLDYIKSIFLNKLESVKIKKDDIVSALRDYEDTLLCYTMNSSVVDITSKGHDIILTCPIPPILANDAIKKKDQLDELLLPIKDLVNELSGSLRTEVNDDDIIMTISCPKQEKPEKQFPELLDDSEIYNHSNCHFFYEPTGFLINLSLLHYIHGRANTFDLEVRNSYLNSDQNRNALANFLSHIDELETDLPLTAFIVQEKNDTYKLVFGSKDDKVLVTLPSFFPLDDEKRVKDLCKIINSKLCAQFDYFSETADLPEGALAAIYPVLEEASKKNNCRIDIEFEIDTNRENETRLRLYDESDISISHSKYFHDIQYYAGYITTLEKKTYVINTYDQLVRSFCERNTQDCILDFLMSDEFFETLRSYNIYPTDDFIAYQRFMLNTPEMKELPSDMKRFELMKGLIEAGSATIDDKGEKIFLDGATHEKHLNFLNRHILW